jgi:hypothetical protein
VCGYVRTPASRNSSRARDWSESIWEAFNAFNHTNITAVRTTDYAHVTSPLVCGIAGVPCA